MNARRLSDKGAAVMIRQDNLTGSALAGVLRRLYKDPKELKAMSGAAKAFGKPGAAEMIAKNFMKALAKK